jgi:predicted glycosyltransferase
MGNFIELEKKYNLIYNYNDPNDALIKSLELLKNNNLKVDWAKKRQKLLQDKIDVTKLIIELIEDYPRALKKNLLTKFK